jgi:Tfp pilus assembly ATPase PilU
MGTLEGMRTLDQALAELVKSGVVTEEEAMKKTSSQVKLTKLLQVDKDTLTPSAVA